MVIGFVLPFDPIRDDRTRGEYAAAITQLRAGLTYIADCVQLPPEDIHLILVERVTVLLGGGESREFETPGVAGVLLLDPEKPGRFVDPGGDPDAIVSSLQGVVASYFDAPRCASPPGGDAPAGPSDAESE